MESWRKCWREGFAPQLSDEQLASLRDALDQGSRRQRRWAIGMTREMAGTERSKSAKASSTTQSMRAPGRHAVNHSS